MIQRIQSIFLLLVVVIGIVSFFLPIASFTSAGGTETLTTLWAYPYYILQTLTAIIILLAAYTLFDFKHRRRQMRFCSAIVLLYVGYFCLYAGIGLAAASEQQATFGVAYGITQPVINVILVLLAKRQIKKDDDLVRSADRLR